MAKITERQLVDVILYRFYDVRKYSESNGNFLGNPTPQEELDYFYGDRVKQPLTYYLEYETNHHKYEIHDDEINIGKVLPIFTKVYEENKDKYSNINFVVDRSVDGYINRVYISGERPENDEEYNSRLMQLKKEEDDKKKAKEDKENKKKLKQELLSKLSPEDIKLLGVKKC